MDEREEPHGTGSARDFIPQDESLPILRDAVQKCQGCGLYAFATQAVFGEGPTNAKVMLVGEQPGDREDVEGEPFVGPAGQLLDRALVSRLMPPHGALSVIGDQIWPFEARVSRKLSVRLLSRTPPESKKSP